MQGNPQGTRCTNHLNPTAIDLAELRAQAFVALNQAIEAHLQRIHIQRAAYTQHRGNVVRTAVGIQLPQEPLTFLGKGQRQGLVTVGKRHRGRRGLRAPLTEALHERLQRTVFEQRFEWQGKPQHMTHAGNHLGSQQRMPAQFEEVIVKAYPLQTQDVGPDGRNLLLQWRHRGHVILLQGTHVRLGQRLAVQLAIGRQWHALQGQQMGRHHIVRQAAFKLRLECFAPGQQGLFRLHRHHIADQLLPTGTGVRNHRRVTHRRLLQQARFDFAGFHAKTTNLDLMIDTPQVIENTVFTLAYPVTAAIQAGARGTEGVGYKTFGGHAWAVQVAARQAFATEEQLTCNPLG